ncbi:MAG: hypothetical protein GY835_08940 [bacterium]|nr:hypothetical protein [bacterium]
MKIRQTLILSLTAAVVVALLTPGSWARADESAAQFGIQSYCYAEAHCFGDPSIIACEGELNCSSQNDPGGYVECDGQRTLCPFSGCNAHADCFCGATVECSGDSNCSAKDDPEGYVECDGVSTYCPTGSALTVDLTIPGCVIQGSTSVYDLIATASGGYGCYSFSWANATPISPPTANPNDATSTISYKKILVRVTVTSGSLSASASEFLMPDCVSYGPE